MKYVIVKSECCDDHKPGGPVGTRYNEPYHNINLAYHEAALYIKEYSKNCSCKFEVRDAEETEK